MAKVDPDAPAHITKYINEMPEFARKICTRLREIIFKAAPGITEDWKWGPNYRMKNMILGYGAAKKHVTLAFYRGDLLEDTDNIFTMGHNNAHNRGLKFKDVSEIDEKVLIKYIKSAVKADEKEIPVVKNKSVAIPEDLRKALKKAKVLEKFEATNFTNRKEYAGWVEGAKKEETRIRRIEKAVQKIAKGEKFS
jgi:uncharacterized protein YdeI (YjbR/CyaY-like superfamily)